MTIAQPNYNKQLGRVLRLLFLAIAACGIVSIFFYNRMIVARAAHDKQTQMIEKLTLESADLKNSYYKLLDDPNLLAVAHQLGYVTEPKPNYLRVDQVAAYLPNQSMSLTQR